MNYGNNFLMQNIFRETRVKKRERQEKKPRKFKIQDHFLVSVVCDGDVVEKC